MKLIYFICIIILINSHNIFGQSTVSQIDTIVINSKKAVIFSDKTWEYVEVLNIKEEYMLSLHKTDSLALVLQIKESIEDPRRQMVTASLSGRSVTGSLPRAVYNSLNQGKVVVAITVDQNGVVTKANARTQGSTVQDAALWKAAEDAARKTRFNVKKDAPVYQTGTITYIFQLT